GAAFPVMLSAIGATVQGKRTAFIYPLEALLGVIFCSALFYIPNAFFPFPWQTEAMNPFSIAGLNTILRLIIVILMLPFDSLAEQIVCKLFPDGREGEFDPGLYLEERFIAQPALAIEQSRMTIGDMASLCEKAISESILLISKYEAGGFDSVKKLEDAGDRYEDVLGSYLVKLTAQSITPEQNEAVSLYLHTLSDFERISDHALNIALGAQELFDKDINFSGDAAHELKVICAAVEEVVSITVAAFKNNDLSLARRVEPLEELIDDLCDESKLGHVDRLKRGECTIEQGFVFNDLQTNLERVSDHCSNIAVAMIELEEDLFATHEYLHEVKSKRNAEFERRYEEYRAKFSFGKTA
ncbi:MAG: Na/Pi cotransporter family protein, partial [Lachnospiraceae bacterium]|nr:Na/Pi cotransporter family protein [Lachnospiraceae bacterium]